MKRWRYFANIIKIIGKTLNEQFKAYYQKTSAEVKGSLKEKWSTMVAAIGARIGNDITIEWINQDLENLEFKITKCAYAYFFRELGEPELGSILLCELDNHVVDAAGPDVECTRTQTIMRGGMWEGKS